jgi:Transaldolase/Fructose-6-phosphate aldolase
MMPTWFPGSSLLVVFQDDRLSTATLRSRARPWRVAGLLGEAPVRRRDIPADVLYVKALAAPLTVNTMPEGALKALADHGELGAILPADGGDSEAVLAQFAKAGVDVDALAAQLQEEGAKSFVKSWQELMEVIVSKSADLRKAS